MAITLHRAHSLHIWTEIFKKNDDQHPVMTVFPKKYEVPLNYCREKSRIS